MTNPTRWIRCPFVLHSLFLGFLLLALAGCRVTSLVPSLDGAPAWEGNPEPYFLNLPAEVEEVDAEEEAEEGSLLGTILLYIPNRIFDAVELVRFGVNAGVGLGADLRATWVAKAVAIHDSSVGVGLQGFRHLPVCARLGHTAIGVGPIKTPSLDILDWTVSDYDIRVELFVLLVGAHVAVDLGALGDFLAGILTFDPSEDDFIIG